MTRYKTPTLFLSLYIVLFVTLAINPHDRDVWFIENLLIVLCVIALVWSYPIFKFSNTSYFFMWLYFSYHTIGAHYTFGLVPFGYVDKLLSSFGLEFIFTQDRNNFDRLGHFLVGVFAYPIVELMLRKSFVKNGLLAFMMAVFAIGFWAALYEIIEMFYAILEGGSSGTAFLGSQGDIWDAQKDMLLNILGAIIFASLAVYNFKHYSK